MQKDIPSWTARCCDKFSIWSDDEAKAIFMMHEDVQEVLKLPWSEIIAGKFQGDDVKVKMEAWVWEAHRISENKHNVQQIKPS
jgi:hypothetical protein